MRRLIVVGTGVLVALAAPLLVNAAQNGPAPPIAPSLTPPDPAKFPAAVATEQAREAAIPTHATVPNLTAAQSVRAPALAAADASIKSLVVGQAYKVERVGPWTTTGDEAAGKAPQLIGAAVEITLPTSISIRGQRVPELIYDIAEATSTPYQTVQSQLDANGVQSLTVLVDLRTEKVVGVVPGPPGTSTAKFTRPPGFKVRVTPRSSE